MFLFFIHDTVKLNFSFTKSTELLETIIRKKMKKKNTHAKNKQNESYKIGKIISKKKKNSISISFYLL